MTFTAFDPRTGTAFGPTFADATDGEVGTAVNAAVGAAGSLAQASAAKRAAALDAIASGLEDLGDELVEIADAETALGCERIRNERVRTCNQLRAFAQVATRGDRLDAVIDHADPELAPARPRPAPDGGAHRADRRVRREQLSARVQCGGRRHRPRRWRQDAPQW